MKVKLPVTLRDCLMLLAGWLIILLFLCLLHVDGTFIGCWVFLILPGIAVYAYTTERLIPFIKRRKKSFVNYLLRLFIIAAIAIALLCVLYILTVGYQDNFRVVFLLILMFVSFQPLIVGPISWLIYYQRAERLKELTDLKTALGKSTANLDFLRSQINPHFLFNALNTLYGTALQENADRTGMGIQKLGDMMRFMLQENVQEKISLTREIEYLNNYIELQKLRTQTSLDIVIDVQIDEQLNGLQIAPMLLIPFVENAFKHGISLREPSHIKIVLQTRDNELFFDVTNAVHPKTGTDPEKNESGIGLDNVKQRLQLLYHNRYDLVVRESAKEFFIHLTVQF